jgi:hypothetical protein
MSEVLDLDSLMLPHEREATGVSKLTEAEVQALVRWGVRMYRLGQSIVANIDKVKYDGGAIVLDDGSRWDVDAVDSVVAEGWAQGDRVVVMDGEMFRLDQSECVAVEQDRD